MTGCKITYTEQKFQDQRNYRVSTDKAIKDGIMSSLKPKKIEDGVREIANLIKSGRIKYTENDIYFNERHLSFLHKNDQFK
jgi:hypothetical protein